MKRALIERASEGTGDDDDLMTVGMVLCDESVHVCMQATRVTLIFHGVDRHRNAKKKKWLADSDSSARGEGRRGARNCEMRK